MVDESKPSSEPFDRITTFYQMKIHTLIATYHIDEQIFCALLLERLIS